MPSTFSVRFVVAVFLGVVAALLLVVGVEAIGHRVYPTPEGIDLTDAEQLRRHVEGLPVGAFLFVLSSWVIATFVGGLVAAFVARSRPHVFASTIGLVIFLASLANLIMIPHPTWFSVTALVAIPVAAWAAGAVATRRAA